jgi:hypothetical protein
MNLYFNQTLKLTYSRKLFSKTKPWIQIYGYTAHITFLNLLSIFVLNLSSHPFLDFEMYNTEETKANPQEDDEVYYEELDLWRNRRHRLHNRISSEQ